MTQDNLYLLLDSRNTPLARGVLENQLDAPCLQVRVLDNKISTVMEHEEVHLISMADSGAVLLGRIIRHRNDSVVLEKLQTLGSELRQNLRMPVHFRSFIYPLTGRWHGRREIESNDLSCTGISFYCGEELEDGEWVEVVIPVTEEPLILRCEVLRRRPCSRADALYATKFVELCNDEEMLMREAVFNIQLQTRPSRTSLSD